MYEFDHERGLFIPRKKLHGHEARLVQPHWMVGHPTFFGAQLPYALEVQVDRPWAYYRLKETSGTVAQNQGTTFATAGTYSGAVTLGQAGLVVGGKSGQFAGTGMINTNMNNNMGTASFSVECLFNPAATGNGTTATLIGKYSFYASAATDFPFRLAWIPAGNNLSASFSKGDDFTADASLNSAALTPGQTHHVVVNYTPNVSVEMWLDGQLVASQAINFTINANGQNWTIGRAGTEVAGGVGQSGFAGLLSEAAIYYNQTLSATRIKTHYAACGIPGA